MEIVTKIEGLEQIEQALRQLTPDLQRKSIESATSYAFSPVVSAAKRKVPVGLGILKRSLGIKKVKYKGGGVVWIGFGARSGFKVRIGTVKRGPRKGKPIYSNPTNYLHLVEMGTATAKARPFLRPAFDANHQRVHTRFTDKLSREIDRHVARLRTRTR